MRFTHVATIAALALVPSVGYAQPGQPVPMLASHQPLNTSPPKCIERVRLALAQFHSGPIETAPPFVFGQVPNGGSVSVYCMPNGNQSLLMIIVASSTGIELTQFRDNFRNQIFANPD